MSAISVRRTVITSRTIVSAALVLASVACDNAITSIAPGFLGGTSTNHEIGVVLNSTGKALTLFQLGSHTTQKEIALGTSSTVSPIGFTVRGRRAAVPLGNAASVALVDLEAQAITRFYTFASGNATGAVFSDDTTLFVANSTTGFVGRVTVGQAADAVTALTTVPVAPQPSAMAFAGGRVLVISANLDDEYNAIGNGVVTAIDPVTMAVIDTVHTGGTNPMSAAVGPDGMLYVLNTTADYSGGSLTIVNPTTMTAVSTIDGFGAGPGAISIDANGIAYISGFFFGTLVWNTNTHTFLRGPGDPVCAKVGVNCRGAFASTANAAGDIYQVFFGSSGESLPPYVFVFRGSSYTLSDSISVGTGPSAIDIRTY